MIYVPWHWVIISAGTNENKIDLENKLLALFFIIVQWLIKEKKDNLWKSLKHKLSIENKQIYVCVLNK